MKITNTYFELSEKEQKRFQIKLGISCLIAILTIGIILFLIHPRLTVLLPFFIVIVILLIAPFFDVPALVKKGDLTYYSLFLLAEKEKNGVIKIHGGTLFDYYFVFQKKMTAQERTKMVLLEYLKGLKNLVNHKNEAFKIQGTSYIINKRTAHKVGLKKIETNGIQRLILFFNYINVMVSISFVKKAIHFPNLNQIITLQGNVADIREREAYIDDLIKKLEQK